MQTPDWADLRVLLEIHRKKSFLGAGRALGLSTSTVARRISALEKQLGRSVVHRTAHGASLEKEALPWVAAAEGFEQALAVGRRDAPADSPYAGTVRISVPDGFGPWLVPACAQLQRQHPRLEIELVSELRYVNLATREADLAVRAGKTQSPDLIARFLGEPQLGLFASEAYLDRMLPKRFLAARDYAEQHFVVEDLNPAERKIPNLLQLRGATHFPFRSNVVETRLKAAEAGLGLTMLTREMAPQYPRLHPVRLEAAIPGLRFYLTYHRQLRQLPRVKAVADALVTAAREVLQTNAD